MIRREESEEEEVDLQNLPAAEEFPPVEDISDEGSLFVDEDEGHQTSKRPRANTDASIASGGSLEPQAKRNKGEAEDEAGDNKKKMAMSTTYEGFAMYGRVLCLVVKRKDQKEKGKGKERSEGQAMMEDWIASTQMRASDDDGS